MAELIIMVCPQCHAGEKYITTYLDPNMGQRCWKCSGCGHLWSAKLSRDDDALLKCRERFCASLVRRGYAVNDVKRLFDRRPAGPKIRETR